jgi:hypothetical protein
LLGAAGPCWADVWGIKSTGSSDSLGVGGGGSIAPAHLFRFSEDGTSLIDVGAITLNGSQWDADGLAIDASGDLYAYLLNNQVTPVGGGVVTSVLNSTLVRLNKLTGQATVIGSALSGRDIRGAAFDTSGQLWALDAANNELLAINSLTGAILGSPIGLTFFGSTHNLTNGTDLAFRADGTLFLVDDEAFYTVNPLTGVMTFFAVDPVSGDDYLTGLAFSYLSLQDLMFALEVNGTDDLFTFDTDGPFTRTLLLSNILSGFNSGRGDLAAQPLAPVVPIPAPAALPAGLILLSLAALRRRGVRG